MPQTPKRRNATQTALFDDGVAGADMALATAVASGKPLNKAQASFQRLVAKIERQRGLLQQWQAYSLRFELRVSTEMAPARQAYRASQRQMVALIDELLEAASTGAGKKLGRVQQAKLKQLLVNLAAGLLEEDGDDDAIRALHDKYSDISHDEGQQEDLAMTQAFLEDVFDMEIGDEHGATNIDELMAQAHQQMQTCLREQAEADAAQREARATKRAKSRPGANEATAKEQAAKAVSQSVREVYRKLASALHPDREPDDQARQRKTAMMQRVNQAYQAGDLLSLLSLQIEIEQIDADHLASVPAERLAHYNQVLREQLAELEAEVAACCMPFRQLAGLGRSRSFTPAAVDAAFNADLAELRMGTAALQADLVAFRDPKQLSSMLQQYELEPEADGFDELILSLMAPATAPRNRARRRP